MTITLPKKAEETLALIPAEERERFLSRAIQGEWKIREFLSRKNDPEIEELVDGAYSYAQKLNQEPDEKVFAEFNDLFDEINS